MALSNSSISSPSRGAAAIRRLRQHRGPDIHFEHSVDDPGGITLEHLGHGRAELRATPGSDDLNGLSEPPQCAGATSTTSARCTMWISTGISSPRAPFGIPRPSPALEYIRQRLPDLPVQSIRSERTPAELQCESISLATWLRAVRVRQLRGCRAPSPAIPAVRDLSIRRRKGQPGHVHRVGVRPEGDVIAEERRKFMGIGVTTDPSHQICVVHNRPLLGVEAHPLSDACRNQ